MPKKKRGAKKSEEPIIYIANPQKAGLRTPPADAHGLVIPNGSFSCFIGGVGSGKTLCACNVIGRTASWLPYEHIYLSTPCNEATQKGEYALLKTKLFENNRIPPLKFWADKPGHSLVILDDLSLTPSTRKDKEDGLSQRDRLDRLCGHVRSHHSDGLDILCMQQQLIAVPTSLRRLVSHWFLFPSRIDMGSLHTIARSVMINKRTLEALFRMCIELGPYTFLLVEQAKLPTRARVRINGVTPVPGIN